MSKNIYRIKKKGDLDEIMRNNFLKPICIIFTSKSSDENSYKKRRSDDSILQHAKWFLPLLTLAYIILYTVVVIYVYL